MCVVDVYSWYSFFDLHMQCTSSFLSSFFFRFSSTTVLEPAIRLHSGMNLLYELSTAFFFFIQTLTLFHALAFMYKKLNSRLALFIFCMIK